MQKYKVYVNNKIIAFRSLGGLIAPKDKQLIIENPPALQQNKLINQFIENDAYDKLIVTNSDPRTAFMLFAIEYDVIKAAGGILKNSKGEILVIFRNGLWDLPKGKANNGEKSKAAAIREVQEETGINDIQLVGKVGTTLHTLTSKNVKYIKRTVWYEMTCHDDAVIIPQLSEGITEARWISLYDMDFVMNNTYKSIEYLLKKMKKRHQKLIALLNSSED